MPRFAVVDLETSGLSSRRHRILQLAMVTVEADGTRLDSWETLVKLRWPWQRVGPTQVHGLRRGDLRGAPPLDEVLDEFSERLDGALFTAHNAEFDSEFLLRAARRRQGLDLDATLAPRLCTLRMSRRLDPERERSHRLGDVCDRYGVEISRPHDALADATATAEVLPHLLAAHDISEPGQLEPHLDAVT
ncbi:MAG: 3'-5' exonuclease [Acidimicrobiia bacterium]|nr:3'-5' exonuclease [Acidimicrobiia bacterium]